MISIQTFVTIATQVFLLRILVMSCWLKIILRRWMTRPALLKYNDHDLKQLCINFGGRYQKY